MGKFVDRSLLSHMLYSELFLNSLQFLIPIFHLLIFFIDLIDFALELSLNILWEHCHSTTLSGSFFLHKLFNSSKLGLHFYDFSL